MNVDPLTDSVVLEVRRVAGDPEGARIEWRRLLDDEDTLEHNWYPRHVDEDGAESQPDWIPLPGSQYLFFQCPIYECLYEGTRGPGKTMSLVMDFAKDVGKGHGKAWRGVLFRRHYKDLDDAVKKIEEVFSILFPGFQFKKSKADYMAVWPTGEALLFRASEDDKDYDDFHGHEYPWIGFEELTQWPTDVFFKQMQSCSRSTKPGINCRVRSTTNPYGVGHNWVKKRYNLPQGRGKVIRKPEERERVAIHGHLDENFLLLHSEPHYKITIKNAALNEAQVDAWLYGDWDVTAGGMFDDLWDSRFHVIPTFPARLIPPGWIVDRSYDHGQSSPFSYGLWLESNGEPIEMPNGQSIGRVKGDLILYAEWYGCRKVKDKNEGVKMQGVDIAQGIIDREEDWGVAGRVQPGPADTEIFTPKYDKDNVSVKDDMADIGVDWERADKSKGSRKRGWEAIRGRLKGAKPNRDGTREKPGIFFCDRCEFAIELLPPTPRDEKKDLDDVPETYEDHVDDMVRYRATWIPPGMWRSAF